MVEQYWQQIQVVEYWTGVHIAKPLVQRVKVSVWETIGQLFDLSHSMATSQQEQLLDNNRSDGLDNCGDKAKRGNHRQWVQMWGQLHQRGKEPLRENP